MKHSPYLLGDLDEDRALAVLRRRAASRLWARGEPDQHVDVIFVGGAPRSGTTLLQNMLCTSPTTNPLIPECAPITGVLRLGQQFIRHDQMFPGTYFADQEQIRDKLHEYLIQIFDHIKRQYQCEIVVVKSPVTTKLIPMFLWCMRGRARCICLVRDPCDIISSLKNWATRSREMNIDHYFHDMDIQQFCRFVLSYYGFIVEVSDEYFPHIFLLKYETLVTRTKSSLARLERITGLDLSHYDPQSVWPDGKLDLSGKGAVKAALSDLWGRPLTRSRIGSALSNLSLEDRQKIVALCEHFYSAFRYAADARSTPLAPISPLVWRKPYERAVR